MKAFFAALQFLTVIPLPQALLLDEKSLGKSVPFFPLVGLFIGVLAAAADLLFGYALPSFAATCLTVLVLIAITGGLHMDGLADTADGFWSARTRDKMLVIMRDSRIGTMGVLAIFFVVSLKIAALIPIAAPQRMGVLIIMPMAGRTAIIIMMTALRYARTEGGLAAIFARKYSWWTPAGAIFLLLAAGGILGGWLGLAASVTAVVAAGLVTRYAYKKIGGFTGDTLGAVSEITETVLALAAAAWIHAEMPL